jgi:hypothetical protein
MTTDPTMYSKQTWQYLINEACHASLRPDKASTDRTAGQREEHGHQPAECNRERARRVGLPQTVPACGHLNRNPGHHRRRRTGNIERHSQSEEQAFNKAYRPRWNAWIWLPRRGHRVIKRFRCRADLFPQAVNNEAYHKVTSEKRPA